MSFLPPPQSDQSRAPQWYAAYVCVRHEKRIADELARRSVEHFLPLYQKQHQWKQRQWTAELPLFPGYVFVRIPLGERLRVLAIPNIVTLVGFAGKPTALSSEEIETMRRALAARKAEPHPYLTAGKRVRVNSGALAGIEGVILRHKKQLRIVVSIDGIHRSMALELYATDLELVTESRAAHAVLAA